MSEKYTVNFYWSFENNIQIPKWEIREWQNLKHGEDCYLEYATLDSEHKAELICRLLNENEKRKSLPKNINIKQINIVPVQNTCTTQCYAYMYALDNEGILWFKRDNDTKWTKESLECE